MERQAVSDGRGGYQGVVGSGGRLASDTPQVGRHRPERTCGRGIKRNRFEVGFGLLYVGLPGRALRSRRRY